MDSNENLKEYRCACGKLLFKGANLNCRIEIKCKRCGQTSLFGEFLADKNFSFMLFVDEDDKITDACYGAQMVLKYTREQLIGKPIAQICPSLADVTSNEVMRRFVDSDTPYRIHNNAFVVRDGESLSVESYCIKNGDQAGRYIMFSNAMRLH